VIEFELLKTALLLGGLIWVGGCYGILYGIGKLANWRAMQLAAFACYGLQCMIALAVVGDDERHQISRLTATCRRTSTGRK
jgi:hypothetical protein